MNKEQIKEAILGQPDCRGEKTPLCQFATFYPDMEMVEILLKGADIQKSFNGQPLAWVYQFCEPNWDTMLRLLFKYKYYGLHLHRKDSFTYLIQMLRKLEMDTILYVFRIMKGHGFLLTSEQKALLNRLDFEKFRYIYIEIFGSL